MGLDINTEFETKLQGLKSYSFVGGLWDDKCASRDESEELDEVSQSGTEGVVLLPLDEEFFMMEKQVSENSVQSSQH